MMPAFLELLLEQAAHESLVVSRIGAGGAIKTTATGLGAAGEFNGLINT